MTHAQYRWESHRRWLGKHLQNICLHPHMRRNVKLFHLIFSIQALIVKLLFVFACNCNLKYYSLYFSVFFSKNIISKKARELVVGKVFKHEIKFCYLLLNSNTNHHYLFKMPFIYLKQKLFVGFEEFGYVQRIICLWVNKNGSWEFNNNSVPNPCDRVPNRVKPLHSSILGRLWIWWDLP